MKKIVLGAILVLTSFLVSMMIENEITDVLCTFFAFNSLSLFYIGRSDYAKLNGPEQVRLWAIVSALMIGISLFGLIIPLTVKLLCVVSIVVFIVTTIALLIIERTMTIQE